MVNLGMHSHSHIDDRGPQVAGTAIAMIILAVLAVVARFVS